MKLSKKIEDAQKRINSLKDQLAALSNKDNPSEDDVALMDELPNQIEDADAELQRNHAHRIGARRPHDRPRSE